jgi:TolA-binding protein
MVADIDPLKTDSLDEVARMMNDVHRRLDLGRAGQRVRDEEQEIVDKLDKLIEKIEQQMQQQQQQQQQQQSGSPQQAQNQAMQDSQIAGGSGPGDVDNKDIGDRAGWGNLPPAERQEALQRLTEELPSHYREVIEGYFRQLAKERR